MKDSMSVHNTTESGESMIMENTTPVQNTTEPRNQWNRKALIRSYAISIFVNAVLPFVIYIVLKRYTSVSDFVALALTGVPPLIDSLVGIIIRRRVDTLAVIVLFGIAVSLGAVALGGSPQLLLVRESFITTASGVALLASLLFRRPVGYYVFRQGLASNNQERIAWFNNLVQQNAPFRTALRVLTAIWGFGLVLEGLARVYLAYTLPVAQFLAVSPTVSGLIVVAIFVCTGLYVRQWRRKHGSIIRGLK